MSSIYCVPKMTINQPINLFEVDEYGKPMPLNPIDTMHGAGPVASLSWLPERSIIVVDHATDDKTSPEVVERFHGYLNNGIDIGSRHYVPFCMGSSQARDAASFWIDEQYKTKVLDWWHCGLPIQIDTISQVEKDARMLTTTSSWDEVFGPIGLHPELRKFYAPVDVDRIAVFEDCEAISCCSRDYTYIDEKDQIHLACNKEWEETITDGGLLYVIDDLSLSDEDRQELMELVRKVKLIDFTINAPGFKGLMHPILKSSLISLIEKESGKFIVEDYLHDEVDLHNVQVITFKSAFKWSKAKCIEHFAQYAEGFKKYHHSFGVCVIPHKRPADMPYQMVQGLFLDEEDNETLINRTVSQLESYTDIKKASRLAGGKLGEAVRLYPELVLDEYVGNTINKTYQSKRWRAAGGRAFGCGEYVFAMFDVVAAIRWVSGINNEAGIPEGFIPKGHVADPRAKIGQLVMQARNPFPGLNWNVKKAMKIDPEFIGFFSTEAICNSAYDASMTLSQMDFDGDKCLRITNKWFISCAVKAINKTGYKLVKWDTNTKTKTAYSDENFVELLRTIKPAEIGVYAMNSTKSKAVFGFDLRQNAIFEKAVTSAVDEAKGKSTVSEAAKSLAASLKNVKKPLFVAYAKSTPHNGKFAEQVESCQYTPNCAVEVYSQSVLAQTTQNLELNTEGLGEFRYSVLYGNTECPKLAGLGAVLEGRAQRHRTEYAKLVSENAPVTTMMTWSEWDVSESREEILAYGRNHGLTDKQTIAALVKFCYNGFKNWANDEKSIAIREARFRMLWVCFGEELVENIEESIASGKINEVVEEVTKEIDYNDEDLMYLEDEYTFEDGEFSFND